MVLDTTDEEQCRRANRESRSKAMTDKSPTPANRNWTEDFSHENGNYCCICSVCGQNFMGHKRRVVCKVCTEMATPKTPAPSPLTDETFLTHRVAEIRKTYSSAGEDADVVWLCDTITALRAQLDEAETKRDGALKDAAQWSREYGELKAKLEKVEGELEWLKTRADMRGCGICGAFDHFEKDCALSSSAVARPK